MAATRITRATRHHSRTQGRTERFISPRAFQRQAPIVSKHPHTSAGVALARLGKLDDLSSDRLTNWIGIVWGGAERRKRHLKCNSHLMDGLGVEATCTLQIRPDGHVEPL